MTSRPRVAICYDFDGTLSPGNMQEYGFFSALGKSAKGFWEESKKLVKEVGADQILAYMMLMLERAGEAKIKTRRLRILSPTKTARHPKTRFRSPC